MTAAGSGQGWPEPDGTPGTLATRRSVSRSRQIAVLASRVRAQLVFMVLDAACVVAAYSASEVFYWRHVAPADYGWHFGLFVLFVVILTLVSNRVFGLYGRIWRHAGLEEARQMILSTATVALVLLVLYPIIRLAGFQLLHPEVVAFGLFFAAAGMSVLRFHSRIFAWQRGSRGNGLRVAIVGSHDGAASAIREMLRFPAAGLIPVAVFDDDTSVHGMSLVGVPVVGTIGDIPASTSRYMLQQVLLAIPEAPPEVIADVLRSAEAAGIAMKVLPTVHDVVKGPTDMWAIRTGPRAADRGPVGSDPGRHRPGRGATGRSKATVCSSPGPEVPSVRRSAARSPGSVPPCSSSSTTTRRTSTTPPRRSMVHVNRL